MPTMNGNQSKYIFQNPSFDENGKVPSASTISYPKPLLLPSDIQLTLKDTRPAGCRTKCEKLLCLSTLVFGLLLTGAVVVIVFYSLGKINTAATSGKNDAKNIFQTKPMNATLPPSPPSPPPPTPTQKPNRKVCTSEQCVEVAGRILSYMDQTKDPCSDFYSYSCGGFISDKYFDPDKGTIGADTERSTGIFRYFREEMETGHKSDDIEAFKKARVFYKSCINSKTRDARKAEPVVGVINGNGGTPLLGTLTSPPLSLTDILAKLHILGINPLFSVHVPMTSDSLLMGEPDNFNIPVEITEENQFSNIYFNETAAVVKAMADLLTGSDSEMADAFKHLNIAVKLKTDAQKNAPEEPETYSIGRMTKEFTSEIDWLKFFTILLEPAAIPNEHFELKVKNPAYIKSLTAFLAEQKKLNQFRFLRDYFWLVFTYQNAKYLGENMPYPEWNIVVRKIDWVACVNELTTGHPGFRLTMEALFIRRYLPSRISERDAIDDMIERTRKSLINIIQSKTWIDTETKALCVKKAEKMSKKVLYPPSVLNNTVLNKFYKPLEMQPGKYFENYMSLIKWRMKSEYESAINPGASLLNWDDGIYETNAFYSPVFNEFLILAAIVDTPFYETEVPKYVNYGGIGTVIGHEMTHGFDTMGMHFDPNGVERAWWKQESVSRFESRAGCFVSQYGNMSIYVPYRNRTLKVDGLKTLGENIADNGGVHASYDAWANYEKVKQEPILPGFPLSMSNEKLFFISLAQTYCVKSNFDTLENSFLTDEHTPDELRVDGFVKNSDAFAMAFKCPKGSPMNPTEKCKLW